jgi:hypothetical protein
MIGLKCNFAKWNKLLWKMTSEWSLLLFSLEEKPQTRQYLIFSRQFSNSASNIIFFLISLLCIITFKLQLVPSLVLKPKCKNVWNPVKFNLHCLHFPNFCQKSPTFLQKHALFHKDDNKKYLAKMEKKLSSFVSPFPDFDDIFTFF